MPSRLPAERDECRCFIRCDAGLLRLKAGIDLDIEANGLALACHLGRNGSRDLLAVDRFDDVEERNGVRRLVGLQRADQMELDAGASPRLSSGHLPCAFLDPVFAEDPLSGLDHRPDRLSIECL